MTGGDRPARLTGVRIGAEAFDVLGARAAAGRLLSAADGAPGQGRVVVLGHRLWQERFGARASVVGESLILNGEPYTVVGVAPRDFELPALSTDLVIPLIGGDRSPARRSRHQLPAPARPIGARHRDRPGARRAGRDHRDAARALSGHQRQEDGAAPGAAARRDRRRLALDAAAPLRRLGARSAGRLRQPRQPAARARHRPQERARRPHGARSVAGTPGARARDRRSPPRSGGWSAGPPGGALVCGSGAALAHPRLGGGTGPPSVRARCRARARSRSTGA